MFAEEQHTARRQRKTAHRADVRIGHIAVAGIAALIASPTLSARAETLRVPSEYPTIQAGIDAAVDGDVVLVADGTYRGDGDQDISFRGKAIEVRSENGPKNCRFTAGSAYRSVAFDEGETRDAVLRGFTFVNCGGGAMSVRRSGPTVVNCVFWSNRAGGGAAVSCYEGSPAFLKCRFEDNAVYSGSGSSDSAGGAVTISESTDATFERCQFLRNHAYARSRKRNRAWGGAVRISHSTGTTFTNCLFAGNSADNRGGAIYVNSGRVVLYNCTISGNSAGDKFDGIGTEDIYSFAALINSILRDESRVNYIGALHSNVLGIDGGLGNFDADPLFVRGGKGPYYLSQIASGQEVDSPCLDAGSDPAELFGLHKRSTRTDRGRDDGMVDIGYHPAKAR